MIAVAETVSVGAKTTTMSVVGETSIMLVETAIAMVDIARKAADTTIIVRKTLIVTVAVETIIEIIANCVRE